MIRNTASAAQCNYIKSLCYDLGVIDEEAALACLGRIRPRHELSREDASDLIQWLKEKKLERD